MVASSVLTLANSLAPAEFTHVSDGAGPDSTSSAAWLDSLSYGLADRGSLAAFSPADRYDDQASLSLVIRAATNPAVPGALAAIGSALFGLFRQTTRNSGASFSPEPSIDSNSLAWSSPLPVTALRGPLTLQSIMSSLGELNPAVAVALKTELLRLQRQSPNPSAFFSAIPTSPAVLAQAFALATLRAARLPATPAAMNSMIAQMSALANNPNTFANNLIQFSNGFATTSARQHQFASGVFNSEARRFTRELGLVVDSNIAQRFRTILTQRARREGVRPYQYLANVVSSGTSALNNPSSALFTALATATAQAYGLSVQKVAAFMRQQASPEQIVASLNALAASPQVRASLRAEGPASESVMQARGGDGPGRPSAGRGGIRRRIIRPSSPAGGGGGATGSASSGGKKTPDNNGNKGPVGGGGRNSGDDWTNWLNNLPAKKKPPQAEGFVPNKLANLVPEEHRGKAVMAFAALALGLGTKSWLDHTKGANTVVEESSDPLTVTPSAFRPVISPKGELIIPPLLQAKDLYVAALDEDLKGGKINAEQRTQLINEFDELLAKPQSGPKQFPDNVRDRLYQGAVLLKRQHEQNPNPSGSMTIEDFARKHPEYFRTKRGELFAALTAYWLNQSYLLGMKMDKATQKNLDVAGQTVRAKAAQAIVMAGLQTVSINDLMHPSYWGRTQPAGVISSAVKELFNADVAKLNMYFTTTREADQQLTVAQMSMTPSPILAPGMTTNKNVDLTYINSLLNTIRQQEKNVQSLRATGGIPLFEAVNKLNGLYTEFDKVQASNQLLFNDTEELRQQAAQIAEARRANANAIRNAVRAAVLDRNQKLAIGSSVGSEGITIHGAELFIPMRNPDELDSNYKGRVLMHCDLAAKAIMFAAEGSVSFSNRSYENIETLKKALFGVMWRQINTNERRLQNQDDGLGSIDSTRPSLSVPQSPPDTAPPDANGPQFNTTP
jgi:hypothetical protein